jgi:hypothetical protein
VKPTEATALARYMRAHFPSQPIDEYTADALSETLAPYPARDCKQAVLAIAERGEQWCPPTAIKAEVKRIRAKRLADYGPIEPPAGLDPDDVVGWQRWLEAKTRAIADGEIVAPSVVEFEGTRHDVVRELGHIGETVDHAIAAKPSREALERARLAKQAADAERKRAEDEHRADLERMRREDQAARTARCACGVDRLTCPQHRPAAATEETA